MNIAINVELRSALKSQAALDQMTMFEKLHEILCDALDRPDLKQNQEATLAS